MEGKFNNEKRYYVVDFSGVLESDWNNFVRRNSMGYVYHLYQMMMVDEDSGNKNISFAIIDGYNKEIVLVMPLYIRISHDIKKKNKLISRYGIVVKDDLTKRCRNRVSHFFITYMCSILKKYGISAVSTELPALCDYNMQGRAINPLIFWGFAPEIRYTWVVDLSKDASRILTDCEETTRQAIRKFLPNDEYTFCETNESTLKEDTETFIHLSEKTYQRSFGQEKSRSYYEHIILDFDTKIRRVFWIKRKCDNMPIVAAVIHIYNDTAHYSLGASIDEKPVGISKYLIYCIMLELKKAGISYFETGGAYPYLPDYLKKKGISNFKKSFGTFLLPIHRGCFYIDKEKII